ncbi:PDC sensor domain-containing protein [Alkalihalobacterium bogoriense]|uniref:PDC sensor domain-containing protein n=1 Tax=Alkalihalobacterium bogoriense TaxID=246272 RepID=UPI0035709FA4
MESIKGDVFISPSYISAITKQPCITLAKAFLDDNGKIIGVIGMDITTSYK